MSLIQSVRDFLASCPLLELEDEAGNPGSGLLKLRVDFLKEQAVYYSIETTPVDPIQQIYRGGGSKRQFAFNLLSREWFDEGLRQCMDNIGFFEKFSDWLWEQNRIKNFPVLDSGKQPLSIEATTVGYLFNFDDTQKTGRYQIQCRLTYFQKERIS